MAQTKRRRRTKHRGNAAGVVETRGRTSANRKPTGKQTGGDRVHRLDQPPSWRGAANRAAVITLLAVVLFVVVLKAPAAQMLVVLVPMFLIYTVVNYHTDRFVYARRQAKKGSGKA
jgi:hypothetical protein